MSKPDTLQRFLLDHGVRGELVRLDEAYQEILTRHPYPPTIRNWVGEALSATVLLRAALKYSGFLTLQIEGDGPLELLIAQCNEQLQVRGLAKWDEEISMPKEFAMAVGEGYLAITITPHEGDRYQGVVELGDPSLANSLMSYFHKSEQLPTFLLLASNETQTVGLLLQILPNKEEDSTPAWESALQLAKQLTPNMLLSQDNAALLQQTFPKSTIELFDPQPVNFRCNCSLEKMEQALRMYGYEEVMEILIENKFVNVTCEFCNRHYDFTREDIERIFNEKSSSTRH